MTAPLLTADWSGALACYGEPVCVWPMFTDTRISRLSADDRRYLALDIERAAGRALDLASAASDIGDRTVASAAYTMALACAHYVRLLGRRLGELRAHHGRVVRGKLIERGVLCDRAAVLG